VSSQPQLRGPLQELDLCLVYVAWRLDVEIVDVAMMKTLMRNVRSSDNKHVRSRLNSCPKFFLPTILAMRFRYLRLGDVEVGLHMREKLLVKDY